MSKKDYTSRHLAKDVVAKRKKDTESGNGDPYAWNTKPYYRGDPRPPLKNPPRTATATRDSDGNKRELFNPKAKLDPSQVADRRITNPNRTKEPPLTEYEISHPRSGSRYFGKPTGKYDPNFRFPDRPKHTPPKSRVDTDDIVSSVKPSSRTAMEKVIDREVRKRLYGKMLAQGSMGSGQ